MDVERFRAVFDIIDGLSPRDRMELAEGLYTADLTGAMVLDPGEMILRLKDLAIGDSFICMPCPEDGNGNGGLKNGHFIYSKVKDSAFKSRMDLNELFNTKRIKDGKLFTIHPASWVLKIEM